MNMHIPTGMSLGLAGCKVFEFDGSYFQGEKASLYCGPLVVKRGSTRLDDGAEPERE